MTQSYDPYQNAVAERVNGILKMEFLPERIEDHQQAAQLIAEAVEAYNSLRPHLSCHYLTPEQMHRQSQQKPVSYKSRHPCKAAALQGCLLL